MGKVSLPTCKTRSMTSILIAALLAVLSTAMAERESHYDVVVTREVCYPQPGDVLEKKCTREVLKRERCEGISAETGQPLCKRLDDDLSEEEKFKNLPSLSKRQSRRRKGGRKTGGSTSGGRKPGGSRGKGNKKNNNKSGGRGGDDGGNGFNIEIPNININLGDLGSSTGETDYDGYDEETAEYY